MVRAFTGCVVRIKSSKQVYKDSRINYFDEKTAQYQKKKDPTPFNDTACDNNSLRLTKL